MIFKAAVRHYRKEEGVICNKGLHLDFNHFCATRGPIMLFVHIENLRMVTHFSRD